MKIHYSNKEISLSKQQATAFIAFLDAPEHFLTNEQIEDMFWKNQTNKRNSRLQGIQRLREKLKPISEFTISSVNSTGYRLQINEKINSEEKDTSMKVAN